MEELHEDESHAKAPMNDQPNPSKQEAETEYEETTEDMAKTEDSSRKSQSKKSKIDTMESQIGPCVEEDEDEVNSRALKTRHEEEPKIFSSFIEYMKEYQQKESKWCENDEVMIIMEIPRRLPTKKLDLGRFTVIYLL